MKRYIYADNAATTKLDPDAFEAMKAFLLDEYGNASQPYSFSRQPKRALAEARAIIADCIHATPEEIFFTSGGTESDNWVIQGSALADPNYRATITSEFEHHAVLNSSMSIERLGYPVAYLKPSTEGIIYPETLAACITDKTRLVSIMYANNEIGSIQPIKSLAEVAHNHGALFHTDAVQAVGHVEIDVSNSGIDLLSASAHKFNGPKGVGFLYIRNGTRIAAYANGGAQERGMRAGTENVAGIVGMSIALKNNCVSLSENRKHLQSLEKRLLERLRSSGIEFICNGGGNRLPGLLSLSIPGSSGEMLLHRLDLMGICISTGSACDSKRTEISHVLKAIRLDEKAAIGTIRISLGKNNDLGEAEEIANAIIKILGKQS